MIIRIFTLFFIICYLVAFPNRAHAQIILTPENTALGGGGTAYMTGYEALFVNPANLYIIENRNKFEIGAAGFGTITDPVLRERGFRDQVDNFTDLLSPFTPDVAFQDFTPSEQFELLNRNFAGNRTRSQHLFRFEAYWFGLKWNSENRSYALSVRSRAGGRFVNGRGFYSSEPVEINGMEIIDRSIVSEFQTLHEISFGFAESFTFLNGLSPGINELIIGIAPKFVIGGSFQSVNYSNVLTRESNGPWSRTSSYNQLTTGDFTDASETFLATQNPQQALDQSLDFADLFSPTGYGAGLDFGLTYLVPLGKEVSTLQRDISELNRSIRVSFSITDIGFIRYTDRTQTNSIAETEETVNNTGVLANSVFRGIPGQFLPFLNETETVHPLLESNREDNSFASILPTAIHSGALFQFSRLKVMGDVSIGITNNAFNTTKFISYIGTEIRPFKFLPLRAGTRIASEVNGFYSFGFGIETQHFEFNTSVQLRSRSVGPTSEFSGISMGALKFYLQ